MERIVHLLLQVQDVHAKGRPDYFNPGARKYSDKELEELLEDDSRPIYVYEDEQGIVQGYAFLEIEITKDSLSRKDRRSIYIDDLCVDEEARGKHIGTALFSHVENLAKEGDFDSITLNVCDCYSCVIECGLDMCRTTLDIFLLTSSAYYSLFTLRCCHSSKPPYFFLLAIVLRGPLRVRALVLER